MVTFVRELTGDSTEALKKELAQGAAHDAADALRMVAVGEDVVHGIERTWGKIQETLREGVEGRKLRFLLAELNDIIREAIAGLPRLEENARRGCPSLTVPGISPSRLEQPAGRLRHVHAELERLLSALPVNPPVIDVSALKSAGAVQTAEGYVAIEDLLRP